MSAVKIKTVRMCKMSVFTALSRLVRFLYILHMKVCAYVDLDNVLM